MNGSGAPPTERSPRVLRGVALVALVIGAVGSLGFMYTVGSHQVSVILIDLFTGWVASPFLALGVAAFASTRWSARRRTMLHGAIVILALTSLAIYGRIALGPPTPQPAFMFLVVPFASWVFMTTVIWAIRKLDAQP